MNKVLLFVALVAFQLSALAQRKENIEKSIPRKIVDKVEIVVGPSIASIKYSYLLPNDKQVNTLGFAGGLGTSYIINDRFKIVGKICFERKGGRRNGDLETRLIQLPKQGIFIKEQHMKLIG